MTSSKQAFEHVGVTEREYKQWCIKNKKPAYASKSKREFFKKIQMKQIYRDSKTGELVQKNDMFSRKI